MNITTTYDEAMVKAMIAEAVAKEREECAKVCDDIFRHWLQTDPNEQFATPDADDCARAIRERSANAGARDEASVRSNT